MYLHLLSALVLAAALAGCGDGSCRTSDLVGGSSDTVGCPSIGGGAGAPSTSGGAGSPGISGGAASGPVVLSGGGGAGGGSGGSSTGTFCAAGQTQNSQACVCVINGTAAQLAGAEGSGYQAVNSCNSSDYPCCFQISTGVCGCTALPAQLTCDEYVQSASLQMLASCP